MNFIHPSLEIKKTDKGYGIFAKEYIPKNTKIIKEIPVIYKSSNIKKFLKSPFYKQVSKLLLVLLKSHKEQFLKLVPHTHDNHIVNYLKIKDYHEKYFNDINKETICLYFSKIMRNAFYFHDNIPSVLFYGTLINHSCSPNVDFDPVKEFMVFKTIKDIEKDSEIYGLYINKDVMPTMTTNSRKQYLLDNYAFNCNCVKCQCM